MDGIYNQILYVFALQWYSAIFLTGTETPAITAAWQAAGINHHHAPCLPNKVHTFPYLLLTRDPYLKAWNRPGWWERNAWIMYPKYPAVLDMHNPKSGTPNENIVQNQLNRALLSVF